MTPNNIVNMALLKKLDAIAITDHNSCDNVEAVMKVAGDKLIVVPGMEIQTREEIHLLCYFRELDKLLRFDEQVRFSLSNILNDPEIFGQQQILNERDEVVGERSEMLLSSVDMSIDQVVEEVRKNSGVVVPAHVNRSSYSIISQLGFIPPELDFRMLEISQNNDYLAPEYSRMASYYSSDAHSLGEILERECFITVEDLSITGILNYLKGC
jgi:predicted metal-dependent phosphoesterase TrpH